MKAVIMPLILLSLWKQGQAHSCLAAPYSQVNHKIQGHVIKTHSVKSSHLCRAKCAQQVGCHSINYYSGQGICELNSANHLTNPESLVFSAGCQYENYIMSRVVTRCSNNLCSYPLVCKTDKDGQSYKCVPCDDATSHVLSFPRKVVTDKVEHEFQTDFQLTAFTISMWMQADPTTDYHTPLSYATVGQNNEIIIYLHKTYSEITIGGTSEILRNLSLIDDKWYHLCLTWQNLNGSYEFYVDGVKQASNGSMLQGQVIRKGALILGQEQDSYKGGFEVFQSFQGKLSGVNMWDRVLTAQEVSALAYKCPTENEGNFLSWSTLKTKKSSGVKLICSNHCI